MEINIWRKTRARVIFRRGIVYLQIGGEEAEEWSLREFLKKLGITKEDCIKAFEEKP